MSKHYKIQKMENTINTSPPPNPWQLLIWFLSLWICLFWTFHINGTIQYVIFFSWLISFDIMLLRPIHFVAYISISFLIFKNSVTWCWKVTFHLQLLPNISCIFQAVQYIPEPILHPAVCACHSANANFPPPPGVNAGLFSSSVSLLFCYCH